MTDSRPASAVGPDPRVASASARSGEHHRPAVGLMMRQPLLRDHGLFLGLGVDPLDFPQRLEHMAARVREVHRRADKSSSFVTQTMGQDRLEL